jgi:hypothetical protein
MPSTKIADRMFEDALYRHVHDNVTGIDINRDLYSHIISITFTIENKKRNKTIRKIHTIHNEDVAHYRPESIVYKVNKLAKLIDKVPDYIPNEQIVKWIEEKL